MITEAVPVRVANDDPVHLALKAVIEVPTHRYLWTPADGIDFVPRLSQAVFGDGKALLGLTTINNRPAFWVVRIDSSWELCESGAPDGSYDVAEASDEILTALEDDFGRASWEDDDGTEQYDEYPAVDDSCGYYWWRISVPECGLELADHPFARLCKVLA